MLYSPLKNRIDSASRAESHYHIRMLGSILGTLMGLLLLVVIWPVPDPDDASDQIFDTRAREAITLEMIEPTSQIAKPPPPPAPIPPVEVPDDVVLEEIELDVPDEVSIDTGEDVTVEAEGPVETGPAFIAQADVSPKPVRFVEPEYSKEARKNKIRARVTVEVLVDEKGRVRESRVIDRFVLGKNDDPPQPVEKLGYGLEEAAEAAAMRWQFRPGRHKGRVVQTYATLTFSFGV